MIQILKKLFHKIVTYDTTLIVNGKKVNPNSKEGKRITKEMNTVMQQMIQYMNSIKL